MKDSEFFEACAEEIDKGWCQNSLGAWYHSTGDVCAVGAMYRVAPTVLGQRGGGQLTLMQFAIRQAAFQQHVGTDHIPDWNDLPGRTKDQVYDAFMGLAKKLRNEGE